jgi:KDO2-lipid IV(A) lauroyltransferase
VSLAPARRPAARRLRVLTRPARHALAYAALRAFVAVLRLLPLRVALAAGAGLGRLAGLFARRDTALMRANLAHVEDPPAVGACWADLGRRLAELALADRVLARFDVDAAPLRAALAEGRGVLVATCHLGHWELMGAALARAGVAVRSVAARPRPGPLHRWLDAERRRLGVVALPPGGGARATVAALRGGHAVALFVDQATGERGRVVPFFGCGAPTPATFERLLAATGARPLLAWTRREPDGRHVVRFEPVADPRLEALTARVEALVRRAPAQWVWLHDRWRAGAHGCSRRAN